MSPYHTVHRRIRARFYIRALIFDFSGLTRAGRVVRNDRSTQDKKKFYLEACQLDKFKRGLGDAALQMQNHV